MFVLVLVLQESLRMFPTVPTFARTVVQEREVFYRIFVVPFRGLRFFALLIV